MKLLNKNLIIATFIAFISTKSQDVYECEAGSDCFVDCSNPPEGITCNNENGLNIIGGYANKLHVDCTETGICDNLIIDCPLNINFTYNDPTDPECELYCTAEGSCNDFHMKVHASWSATVVCGNIFGDVDNIEGSICTNGIINGTFDSVETIPPSQSIGLACIAQTDQEDAACSDITFDNIGYLPAPNMSAIDEVEVTIYCLNPPDADGNDGVESCMNINFDGGNLTKFVLDATGGIKNAVFDISSPTLDDVDIIIEGPDGFMEDITIWANNSLSILLKLENGAEIKDSKIFGGENIGGFNITAAENSKIDNLLAQGRFYITTQGEISDSEFDADQSSEFVFISNGATQATKFNLTSTDNVVMMQQFDSAFEENQIWLTNAGQVVFYVMGKVEANTFDLRNAQNASINIYDNGVWEDNFFNGTNLDLFELMVYSNGDFENGEDNIIDLENAQNISIQSFGTIKDLELLATYAGSLSIVNFENATFENSVIKASNATNTSFVSYQEVMTADVFFEVTYVQNEAQFQFWGMSEVDIFANNANYLSVICRSFNPNRFCNLEINGPRAMMATDGGPSKPRTDLYCIAFACQNLILNFENGFDDINLITGDCPCASNETYYNATDGDGDANFNETDGEFVECINEWEINCGFLSSNGSSSLFTNEFDCELQTGSEDCCGDVNDDADALQCVAETTGGDTDEFWTDGAIAGFVIGGVVLLIIIFVAGLMFYRRKSESDSNYGRLAETDNNDNNNNNDKTDKNDNGYGATD